MQRALMERVLKIVLEVENLTVNERAHVQDGLAFIRLDATETSLVSEIYSDLSGLINIRYGHQSEEEASAVRVARARSGSQHDKGGNSSSNLSQSDLEQEGLQDQPRPMAVAQDTERRQLAKKINDIIKASTAASAGESTGLNRRARWNTDKLAAGSTLPAGGAITATGNTANAQATARKAAQAVGLSLASVILCSFTGIPTSQIIKQRAAAFAHLKTADTLASAKVNLLVPITNKSFGFAVIDDQLTMVEGAFEVSSRNVLRVPNIFISAYNV